MCGEVFLGEQQLGAVTLCRSCHSEFARYSCAYTDTYTNICDHGLWQSAL